MYMQGRAQTVVKDSGVGEEEVGQVGEDEKLCCQAEVAADSLAGVARACRSCALVRNTHPCCRHSALYTSR
jgi:hypothetical protein